VIYSFKAAGDYAPTFVSDNIVAVFGYAPAEYLDARQVMPGHPWKAKAPHERAEMLPPGKTPVL
jgi:hypothetical protein